MHDWLNGLGLTAWKPALAVLLLPPVPLLLLAALGGLLLARGRRRIGGLALSLGLAGLWLMGTPAAAGWLAQVLTPSPPPLSAAQRQALKGAPHTAIVVLGAGRRAQVLETGEAALKPLTMERLAHGLWLARRTGLPVAYSGGIGHGSLPGATEAEVAQRVATQDFGQPLRWTEDRSRDTRENARYSVALLHAAGIQRIVLVTHAFHQRRALAAFERASRDAGVAMALLPAPVGVLPQRPLNLGDWLPNEEAFALSRIVLHEWLGWLAGA